MTNRTQTTPVTATSTTPAAVPCHVTDATRFDLRVDGVTYLGAAIHGAGGVLRGGAQGLLEVVAGDGAVDGGPLCARGAPPEGFGDLIGDRLFEAHPDAEDQGASQVEHRRAPARSAPEPTATVVIDVVFDGWSPEEITIGLVTAGLELVAEHRIGRGAQEIDRAGAVLSRDELPHQQRERERRERQAKALTRSGRGGPGGAHRWRPAAAHRRWRGGLAGSSRGVGMGVLRR